MTYLSKPLFLMGSLHRRNPPCCFFILFVCFFGLFFLFVVFVLVGLFWLVTSWTSTAWTSTACKSTPDLPEACFFCGSGLLFAAWGLLCDGRPRTSSHWLAKRKESQAKVRAARLHIVSLTPLHHAQHTSFILASKMQRIASHSDSNTT